MKGIIFLFIGMLFGITLFKSEAASWFRIYEMFNFQSFHMYGIISSAVIIGVLLFQLIKRLNIKSVNGEVIKFIPKEKGFIRYLAGGIIFGLGWALTGACPGPLFVTFGAGFLPIAVVIIFAVLGTFIYGLLRDKLPH